MQLATCLLEVVAPAAAAASAAAAVASDTCQAPRLKSHTSFWGSVWGQGPGNKRPALDCYAPDENGMRWEVSKKVTISSVAWQLQHEKGKPHGLGVTILSLYNGKSNGQENGK